MVWKPREGRITEWNSSQRGEMVSIGKRLLGICVTGQSSLGGAAGGRLHCEEA